SSPRGSPEAERRAIMHRLPHLLLLDLAGADVTLAFKGARTLAGAPHDVIEATLPDKSAVTLVVGRNPALLHRLEYRAYYPGLGDVVVSWNWPRWKPDAALGFVPLGHTVEVAGATFQQVEYTRYSAGSPDAAALLNIPPELLHPAASSGEAPPQPGGPATGEVAPGVHVEGVRGFMVMFVEFKDFVLVFDAPASVIGLESVPASDQSTSEAVSEAFRQLVARTCPGKPVRYVVISHHHGDHVGGIRAFAGSGVTVLASPGDVNAVRRALTAPHRLAPDHWPPSPLPSIKAVAQAFTVTDGSRKLEVINVG
ncbi:MAG TPA: MBL fold metallo-hydrolase, partial [Terriglobales bacterium]|nr:MBL fold metallo-hydrolase [Terriglobales bacterium]